MHNVSWFQIYLCQVSAINKICDTTDYFYAQWPEVSQILFMADTWHK